MLIRFSVDGIKNLDLLYTWTTTVGSDFGSEIEEHYHGNDYCKTVINDVCSKLSGWQAPQYLGQSERIGNECFILTSPNEVEYRLSFGINTYERKTARIECVIVFQAVASYDLHLEKLKIELKNRLIQDWSQCTWLADEQSAQLCQEVYLQAFNVENNLRAFASKVLIHFVGINWLKSFGLETISESVNGLQKPFIQRVPEFDNINTEFMSMTLETLCKVLFEGIIYDNEIIINKQQYFEIQKIANVVSKSGTGNNVFNYLMKRRTVKKRIWDDLFATYIADPQRFKDKMTDFIGGRNHVAHSKVLSLSAYKKILNDFSELDAQIHTADQKFDQEEASDEMIVTQEAEDDAKREQEEMESYEESYYRDRLVNEAGIDILDEDQIRDWFDDRLHELYNTIYQRYHLDVCFEVSDYYALDEDEFIFYVLSPAVEDESAKIEVRAAYTLDDDLGGDSTCQIEGVHVNGKVISKCEISFHNGNGSENEDGLMEADEGSEYNDTELDGFGKELIEAIDNLNPYPSQLDSLEYASKGGEIYIADFACEQCGRRGVSINDSFLPIGRCMYCGYENEIRKCQRCGGLMSVFDEEHGFCPSCASYIDKQ